MRTGDTAGRARDFAALGVGSGAHLLVNGRLDVTREMVEQKTAA